MLGGGHAHLQVLQAFARIAPPANVRITLVSPSAELTYSGMVPGLVAGRYAPGAGTIALAPLSAHAGAGFIRAAATALDSDARRVTMVDRDGHVETRRYDLLSIDIGGASDVDALAGAAEHALAIRPIERFTETLAMRLASAPRDLVVVGGGAGGFELAMALRTRVGAAARLHLVSGEPPLLAAYPRSTQCRAERALRRRGIALHQGRCVAVAHDHVTLSSGTRLACELAVISIGSSAPRWLRGSGLATDANGFIATTATLQSASHGNVFAAGDVASRIDAPRPRSGVYAVRAGPPLAANLRRALQGLPLLPYRPQRRALNLLSCGDGAAIGTLGRWSCEGRVVGWLKDRIDRGFVAGLSRPTATDRRVNRAA